MFAQTDKDLMRWIGWFAFAQALLFILSGETYLHHILASDSLFQNSIANFSSPLGKSFVLFFTLLNYLSHMAFLALIPATVIWALSLIFPYPKIIIPVALLSYIFLLLLLIIDTQVFARYHFHLNKTILSFMLSPNWASIFDFSRQEIVIISLIIGFIILLQFSLSYLVWHLIKKFRSFKYGGTFFLTWSGGLLISYMTLLMTLSHNNNLFSQQIPNLPLYNELFVHVMPSKKAQKILLRYSENHFSQPLFPVEELNYPKQPLKLLKPEKPLNIILIMVDSLRFDSLQANYMPHLYHFSQNNIPFQNHYSGGNATQPGLFSFFYSIPSNYWSSALEQKVRPVLFDLLEKNHYQSHILWSSQMHNPPFDKTIYLGLENLMVNGAPGKDVAAWDKHITKKAINYLKHADKQKPFFLNLFYDAPHGYCKQQNYPKPFQPALKYCQRITMSNDMNSKLYYNRYLNSVHFVDKQIGQVLDVIKEEGYLNNSVVIITSDHGQEFNENKKNSWGHAGNFTAYQMHVPLVLHMPGKKTQSINYQTTHYDIIPTLAEELFGCKTKASNYSIGINLFEHKGRLPFILAAGYANMGVIESDRIMTLQVSGRINITDKKANPLPEAKPNLTVLQQVMRLMRTFYQNT